MTIGVTHLHQRPVRWEEKGEMICGRFSLPFKWKERLEDEGPCGFKMGGKNTRSVCQDKYQLCMSTDLVTSGKQYCYVFGPLWKQ